MDGLFPTQNDHFSWVIHFTMILIEIQMMKLKKDNCFIHDIDKSFVALKFVICYLIHGF